MHKVYESKMNFEEKVLRTLTDIQSIIILLANAGNIPIKGRTWLQKEMFLLSERVEKIREDVSYEPDLMGPYSDVIEEELIQLENLGIVLIDDNKISITPSGKQVARILEKKEPVEVLQYIKDYKEFLNDLSQDELLCFVYSSRPDMTKESVKFEKLKPKMEKVLLNLVMKEKISKSRAAELLNKDLEYIIDKLKDKQKILL